MLLIVEYTELLLEELWVLLFSVPTDKSDIELARTGRNLDGIFGSDLDSKFRRRSSVLEEWLEKLEGVFLEASS
jgi:hypothetical protein